MGAQCGCCGVERWARATRGKKSLIKEDGGREKVFDGGRKPYVWQPSVDFDVVGKLASGRTTAAN